MQLRCYVFLTYRFNSREFGNKFADCSPRTVGPRNGNTIDYGHATLVPL